MNNPASIRRATPEDADRIRAIARAAYVKYVARIGREPAPMVADFAARIAAGHAVVAEDGDGIKGYMISWPEADAYFIDNIAVDPEHQGRRSRQMSDRVCRHRGQVACDCRLCGSTQMSP